VVGFMMLVELYGMEEKEIFCSLAVCRKVVKNGLAGRKVSFVRLSCFELCDAKRLSEKFFSSVF